MQEVAVIVKSQVRNNQKTNTNNKLEIWGKAQREST